MDCLVGLVVVDDDDVDVVVDGDMMFLKAVVVCLNE